MYRLSLLKEKEESAQIISDVLDLCFPTYDTKEVDMELVYGKFREALSMAQAFDAIISGVPDGS
jgi:hypothetical protein